MFVGPVFTREAITASRRTRYYVFRSAYVSGLLVLMCTAWLILTGTQVVRNVGDLSRFGTSLFQILAPLQLALAVFFSALMAASGVSQEKDRRTFVLLLLTELSNTELVLGKLAASLLQVLVLLAAAVPLFMISALLGGISFDQIARVMAVTVASALAAGSLGSTLALWREKTFQALALTLLCLVFWLALGEALARGVSIWHVPAWSARSLAIGLSPWQAILAAARPFPDSDESLLGLGSSVDLFLISSSLFTILLNALAVARVRVWSSSREARPMLQDTGDAESIWGLHREISSSPRGSRPEPLSLEPDAGRASVHAAPGRTRPVWDNPILWREIRTWAYGRRVLIIRIAYLSLVLSSAWALMSMASSEAGITRAGAAVCLAPLALVSLILVNAQAVTSLTAEKDANALDLLLVTDLTAKEFVFGKLGGVFYNTKEMVVLPIALCGYLWWADALAGENFFYLAGSLLVLNAFATVLGIHCGLVYDKSRSAIGVSIGTIFFLFVGVATMMRMMVAFSGSFQMQLQPFLLFMGGGGLGLYFALGARHASPAIGVASFICPVATFWGITSYWMNYTLGVFLAILFTYGFATAAMLVPDVFEFDVTTGRTTDE